MMCVLNDRRGMTVLELIVTIGIFGLVITSIVGIFLVSFRSKDIVFDQLEVQGQARKVVQDFVNEARAMSYSGAGAYPVQGASTTEIIFFTNIDNDSTPERVRYFLVTNTLKKGVIQPLGNPIVYPTSTEVIYSVSTNIHNTSSLFYYYDQNYTGDSAPLTQPVDITKIRNIGIWLVLDKQVNLSPVPFVISGQTNLRNLKSN